MGKKKFCLNYDQLRVLHQMSLFSQQSSDGDSVCMRHFWILKWQTNENPWQKSGPVSAVRILRGTAVRILTLTQTQTREDWRKMFWISHLSSIILVETHSKNTKVNSMCPCTMLTFLDSLYITESNSTCCFLFKAHPNPRAACKT